MIFNETDPDVYRKIRELEENVGRDDPDAPEEPEEGETGGTDSDADEDGTADTDTGDGTVKLVDSRTISFDMKNYDGITDLKISGKWKTDFDTITAIILLPRSATACRYSLYYHGAKLEQLVDDKDGYQTKVTMSIHRIKSLGNGKKLGGKWLAKVFMRRKAMVTGEKVSVVDIAPALSERIQDNVTVKEGEHAD